MSRLTLIARATAAVAVLGAVYACDQVNNLNAPTLASGGELFRRYVSLGNSITSGYQSGGINDSTQKRAYPVLLAGLMNTRFAYPSLVAPGCAPPISNFLTQARVGTGSTPLTCNLRNPATAVDLLNNVAVPGATSADPTSASTSASNTLTTLFLGGKTQVQKALELQPTFATVWIGNNDALQPILGGLPSLSTSQATFEANYNAMMSQLKAGAPDIKGVLIGVADARNLPLLFSAALLQSPAVIGALSQVAGAPLTPAADCLSAPGNSSLINFAIATDAASRSAGNVIHCVKGKDPLNPLSGEKYVLDATEQAQAAAIIAGYNSFIANLAGELGFAYEDINPTFAALRASGGIPAFPNLAVPTNPFGKWITNDGVHPSNSAHVLIANELVNVINNRYGTTLPLLPAP